MRCGRTERTRHRAAASLAKGIGGGPLLLKLIAFRPLDQKDICSILLANPDRLGLDWFRTEACLTGLDEERLTVFESFVRKFYVP